MTRAPNASRSPRSRRSRWPHRTACRSPRRSTSRSRPPRTPTGSPRPSARTAASGGTNTTRSSSRGPSDSSGPGTSRTWCRHGSRPWTASRRSCATAPRSPTSAAGTARRRCCSASPTRDRRSPGSTTTRPSIEQARKRATDAGLATRVSFEVAAAADFPGAGYDLVAIFDALHDMPDPLGAARHIREALKPDGTFLLVEPYANDKLEDNINPVGRLYYGASTVICVAHSMTEEPRTALGAQAGEARLTEVLARPVSPVFGVPRRRRSTWSSRRCPDRLVSRTRSRTLRPAGPAPPARRRPPWPRRAGPRRRTRPARG